MNQHDEKKSDREESLREELRELAALDALGTLTDRERDRLYLLEETASPETRERISESRDAVMKQIRNSLPGVEPEPSLKHRVLAAVFQFIEHDLTESVETPGVVDRLRVPASKNWLERFVSGRVSPMWRIAALILITALGAVSWMLMETKHYNDFVSAIVRNYDTNQFEKVIGTSTMDLMTDYRVKHIALAPVNESSARAVLSYYPNSHRGHILASRLPVLIDDEDHYYLQADAPGVTKIVVSFDSNGSIVSVDFDLPEKINPATANWWVIRIDKHGNQTKIMKSLS